MNREPQIGDIVNVTWPDFFPIKALVTNRYSLDLYELIYFEGAIRRTAPNNEVWHTAEQLQNAYIRSSISYLTVVSELSDEG